MTNVLDFHIELVGFEDRFWRDIQISDNTTVAKLGYIILAAYEAAACHLFNIKFRDARYELLIEPDDFEGPLGSAINPMKVKLKDFDLNPGDTFTMEYDYGAGWEWTIEYKTSAPMKKGTGKHYPWITAAEGRGIVEDVGPTEFESMIEHIDKTNEKIPVLNHRDFDSTINWDYRWCMLDIMNGLLKYDIEEIRWAYEEPFETGQVDADEIYAKHIIPKGDNIIDFAAQSKWKKISLKNQQLLLANAFCINCGTGVFNSDYSLRSLSGGDIAIDGFCSTCGAKICRVVERDWFS